MNAVEPQGDMASRDYVHCGDVVGKKQILGILFVRLRRTHRQRARRHCALHIAQAFIAIRAST